MGIETLSGRFERYALLFIVAVYLMLGSLYAGMTPLWQAPDEPAHHNYVMHIVETGRLPVLREGDYPVDYLEKIKAARFPPDMPIEPIRYESHQPPLYYALAAAWVRATGWTGIPAPIRLRLLGVSLGAAGVLLCYVALARALPRQRWLALAAAGFYATLPQHVAMTAAINSDALVEVLVGLVACVLLAPAARNWGWWRTALLGALLGLGLLTKMQSYCAVAFVGVALLWDARQLGGARGWRLLLTRGTLLGAIALALASPWLLRNVRVYGPGDWFGLINHDQVVAGQLTTAQYIAENGWITLVTAFVRTTFQSFWGQFGWMGVPMPQRVYLALALVSATAVVGCAIGLTELARQRATLPDDTRRGLIVLGVWALVTAAGYAWWNTRYVQHQGRYLFPALMPLAMAFVYGLRRAWRCEVRRIIIGVAAVVLLAVVYGLIRGDLPLFAIAAALAWGFALVAAHIVDRRWPDLPFLPLLGGQVGLTLACLPLWIIPNLAL